MVSLESHTRGKKHRAGEVLVEVNNQHQATKLLAQARMVDLDVGVTLHRSLNSSQGVISEPDLLNEMYANLLEDLQDRASHP